MTPHRHWKTGQPCNCTFTSHLGGRLAKTASKLEWLKTRPDKRLQTPEGQAFLQTLEQHYHNDKTDPLFPWLAREWKKGRIEADDLSGALPRPSLWYNTPDGGTHEINPGELGHWADWYNSNHPTRRGLDLMQHDTGSIHSKIEEWDEYLRQQQELADQEKATGGEAVHRFPDGWSVRKLGPEHVEFEGDAMGHCVGGYGEEVRNNVTQIYSLRDPQHQPHATLELKPGRQPFTPEEYAAHFSEEGMANNASLMDQTDPSQREAIRQRAIELGYQHNSSKESLYDKYLEYVNNRRTRHTGPEGASIVQVQGKGNEVPKPEYQARLKQWFETMPEDQRPAWDSGYPIDNINEIPGHEDYEYNEDGNGGYGPHGNYGVKIRNKIKYDSVLESMTENQRVHGVNPTEHDPNHVRAVYNFALERGEIPQLASAVEQYNDNVAMPAYNDHEEHNLDYYPKYPGEEWDPEEYSSQEEWHDARSAYDDAEQEKIDSVPAMGLVNDLYSHLKPHWDEAQQAYVNQPSQQSVQAPGTFSKVARKIKPHPNFSTGKPCTCPWGGRGKTASVHEAAKIDWLRERPDVKNNLLHHLLVNHHFPNWGDEADPLLPWILREVKKGRIRVGDGYRNLADQARASAAEFARHVQEGGQVGEMVVPTGERKPLSEFGKDDVFLDANGKPRIVTPRGDHHAIIHLDTIDSNSPQITPLDSEVAKQLVHEVHRPTGDRGAQLQRKMLSDAKTAESVFGRSGGVLYAETPGGPEYINRQMATSVAKMLDARRKQRKGIDIMQHDVGSIIDQHEEWLKEEETRQRAEMGDVMHDFGDGWTIRRIRPEEEGDEGEQMGHCVGGYDALDAGLYSLRDPKNFPHATIEIAPQKWGDDPRGEHAKLPLPHGGQLIQVQGKENDEPNWEYQQRIGDWIDALGEQGERPYAEFDQSNVYNDPVDDIDSLNGWYDEGMPNGRYEHDDPYKVSPDQADNYRVHYEDPEGDPVNPQWEEIVDSAFKTHKRYDSQVYEYRHKAEDIGQARVIADELDRGDEFQKHVDEWANIHADDFYNGVYDPTHPVYDHHAQWDQWDIGERMNLLNGGKHSLPYHPDGTPVKPAPPANPNQQALFDEVASEKCPDCGSTATLRDTHDLKCYTCGATNSDPSGNTRNVDYQYPEYRGPYGAPTPSSEPLTFSKVAAKPLYYRWVFSPVTGEVTLSHNQEDHPADVRYHGDLAGQINEPGLMHGYAYRIGNGWRLTDWEHKAVEDPFVISQVVRKLNGHDGVPGADWEPAADDFNRMHHGLPTSSSD